MIALKKAMSNNWTGALGVRIKDTDGNVVCALQESTDRVGVFRLFLIGKDGRPNKVRDVTLQWLLRRLFDEDA